jgi:pimeloyl-ACP methyl ester carboxylesterase
MRVTADDGVGLEAVVVGPGDAPGLLLVHGFGGAKEDFADHVDVLAGDHRVVVFDHRGHGVSDAPDDPSAYSLDRLAADTLAVAQATGLRELRLLGHSMGGMVARRVALAAPGLLHALVLVDTSPGAPPGLDPQLVELGVEVVRTEGMAALKVLQDELDPLGSPSYRRVLAERPGFADYVTRTWAALAPAMWSAMAVEIVEQPDELGAMGAITCPTLVVVGDEDTVFLEPSRALAATIPRASLAVIPGAGHSPQFENPDAWQSAVRGFLDSLAS